LAIFAPHHGFVGKTTQAQAGTAGAHVHYITRTGAARLVMGEHMPTDRHQARAWMDEREATDRKNGRVCDKLMLPLPVELDAAQRAELVRDFMQSVGGGRVSWLAAFHDRGKDAHNPHAHVILRDKDHETGKRVFGTTEKGSTERIRELWETAINQALEREGIEARVDRRSLAEQGIDREPGIHIGPNVLAMEARGLRPVSLPQEVENGRVIDWPEIDQGRTRADRQREIEAGNLETEREKGKEKEKGKGRAHVMEMPDQAAQQAQAWAEREADRRAEDRAKRDARAERAARRQAEAQQRTQELLDQARQATRPAVQPEPVQPSIAPAQDSATPDPAPAAAADADRQREIQDQARQAMERAAARWKIEIPHQAEPKPESQRQRPQIDYLARLRKPPPEPVRQAEPMQTAEPAPVWQRVDYLSRIPTRRQPDQAQAQVPEMKGPRVAGPSPEATQRPSYEVAPADRSAEQAETGRFAQMVVAARLRLVVLANRLEAAFEPFRQRQAEQQRQPVLPPWRTPPAWQAPDPTLRPTAPTPRPEAKPPEPPGDYAADLLARARDRVRQQEQKQPGHRLADEIRRRRGLELDGPDF
jgi:hypothetical protein